VAVAVGGTDEKVVSEFEPSSWVMRLFSDMRPCPGGTGGGGGELALVGSKGKIWLCSASSEFVRRRRRMRINATRRKRRNGMPTPTMGPTITPMDALFLELVETVGRPAETVAEAAGLRSTAVPPVTLITSTWSSPRNPAPSSLSTLRT
jgi:hypothetical protein